MNLTPSAKLCVVAAGLFFITALLAGIWKWRKMTEPPKHQAPFYVDTAHRAALMYSFACILLAVFAGESAFSERVNVAASALPITFFAIAVATYLRLALHGKTANQFSRPTPFQHWGMIALITAELGGFCVLFAGFVAKHIW